MISCEPQKLVARQRDGGPPAGHLVWPASGPLVCTATKKFEDRVALEAKLDEVIAALGSMDLRMKQGRRRSVHPRDPSGADSS
ncbi:hypothetical protein DB30_00156 [Enhygromyxa salina]|uniref:Uncharacterized protein n=1 Tax=Enhygromyxa salina TaxID=215803 RepID=A0A0C2DIZ6_9BACT|nr:hypothetical protein [Enhygromyxa salina]KIG19647.1 hypothetical protein DB30_00156 [Enhygromyxa salina]